MGPDEHFDPDTAQRILLTWKALREGKMRVPAHLQHLADELTAAPLTIAGLVNIQNLSAETIRFARSAGMAARHFAQRPLTPVPAQPTAEMQSELFAHFARLFGALTGRAVHLVKDEIEIRDRMLWRLRHEPDAMGTKVNLAAEALEAFYHSNAGEMFVRAKALGGMRLVSGGQRKFGPSALRGVRLTCLYADTQLIPDPVYPFLSGELHLNALHLQLAITLFHILQLRPLVDAEFSVPPVMVFPSFEEQLETGDAQTMHGLEQLAVRVVGPICDGAVASFEDLFDYAGRKGERFAQQLLLDGLFVPPGGLPGRVLTVADATKQYLQELDGVRSGEQLETLKRLPVGVLLLNGVIERLRPHYHLLENATELGAQPLLSQPVHWHYFETCARANALELVRKEVLSQQSFGTLRAIQDDSLSWLADIRIKTIRDLIASGEHRWFRQELNAYTNQLEGGCGVDANAMVREVAHGLASLVQRQRESMAAIEAKYAPGNAAAVAGGVAGIGMAAAVTLLPSLSPMLGTAIPAVAAIGAAGGAVMGVAKAKIAELTEKRQAGRSMLGVLAAVRLP